VATVTRGYLKRQAAKNLGAYFTAVVTVASANPHLTLTVPQIADEAFDAERFQFWYVQRLSPAAVTLTSTSAANPTVVTASADHFMAPGDIVTFTGTGGILDGQSLTVLTTPTTTTFTVASAAGYAGTGAIGSFSVVSQYRLVTTTGLPAAATITMQRAFQGGPTFTALPAGTALEFFLILPPAEWDNAAGSAIMDSFYKDRITITPLIAGVGQGAEYDLTDITKTYYAPWFMAKGQFIRARWRNTATAGAPYEEELTTLFFEEVNFGMKVIIPRQPSDLTNYTAILEVRHYYPAFVSDTSTTTLPERLAIAAITNEALKLIYQKLGPNAKKVYGMAMVLSTNDETEQELRWLDNSAKRDMSDEDQISPSDYDWTIGSWGW
jgi:hypothetical protein